MRRILITGSSGMVGSSLTKILYNNGNQKIYLPSSKDLNLLNKKKISSYIKENKITHIVHLAAQVGGILYNKENNYSFYKINNSINNNVIIAATDLKVKNFINVSSSCMYPKNYLKKMREDKLFTGIIEETNIGYGLSKMSSSILCSIIRDEFGYNYTTLIPCNLFGIGDNFDPYQSHLIPSIIRKSYSYKIGDIKEIDIWGDGKVKREFLYVDNFTIFLKKILQRGYIENSFINVGYTEDFTILKYYKLIWDLMGIKPKYIFDKSKPNGISRKLLDSSLALDKYRYDIKINLIKGLKKTINYYLNTYAK